MSELKPCPFCGGKATIKCIDLPYGRSLCKYKVVAHHEDGCFMGNMQYMNMFDFELDATDAWNRRAE